MAKKPDAMPSFDPSEFWKEYDPTKMMGTMKMPGIDIEAITQFQKRNIEALVAANRTAFEGAQAVFARQSEILREAMEEMRSAFEAMSAKKLPQDSIAAQTELIKSSFEKTVSNMRELSEMVAKSNTQAVDEINKRIADSLDELKTNIAKAKG